MFSECRFESVQWNFKKALIKSWPFRNDECKRYYDWTCAAHPMNKITEKNSKIMKKAFQLKEESKSKTVFIWVVSSSSWLASFSSNWIRNIFVHPLKCFLRHLVKKMWQTFSNEIYLSEILKNAKLCKCLKMGYLKEGTVHISLF